MTNWRESPAPYPNGSSLELGLILGRLSGLTEQQISLLQSQTEILHDIRDTLDAVPHKIAERLPKPAAAASLERPRLSYVEILDLIRRTGLCLLPISLVALVITGKLTLLEAVSMIRQALGVGG